MVDATPLSAALLAVFVVLTLFPKVMAATTVTLGVVLFLYLYFTEGNIFFSRLR